jgi:hypothetical protein
MIRNIEFSLMDPLKRYKMWREGKIGSSPLLGKFSYRSCRCVKHRASGDAKIIKGVRLIFVIVTWETK